jgi:hypothetical protein
MDANSLIARAVSRPRWGMEEPNDQPVATELLRQLREEVPIKDRDVKLDKAIHWTKEMEIQYLPIYREALRSLKQIEGELAEIRALGHSLKKYRKKG